MSYEKTLGTSIKGDQKEIDLPASPLLKIRVTEGNAYAFVYMGRQLHSKSQGNLRKQIIRDINAAIGAFQKIYPFAFDSKNQVNLRQLYDQGLPNRKKLMELQLHAGSINALIGEFDECIQDPDTPKENRLNYVDDKFQFLKSVYEATHSAEDRDNLINSYWEVIQEAQKAQNYVPIQQGFHNLVGLLLIEKNDDASFELAKEIQEFVLENFALAIQQQQQMRDLIMQLERKLNPLGVPVAMTKSPASPDTLKRPIAIKREAKDREVQQGRESGTAPAQVNDCVDERDAAQRYGFHFSIDREATEMGAGSSSSDISSPDSLHANGGFAARVGSSRMISGRSS